VENNANLGFGAANNRASEISSGKYLLFLNSDTILLNDAVKEFFDEAEKNPDTILGCRLTDESGNAMISFGNFTNEVLFSLKKNLYDFYPQILEKRKKQLKRKFEKQINSGEQFVDFVTGADLFISRKIFLDAGKFDENFFMYFEDDDLCRTAKKIGIKSKIFSAPKICHLEGKSSAVKITKLLIQDDSFFYYAKKWNPRMKFFLKKLFFLLLYPIRLFSCELKFSEKNKMTKNILKNFQQKK
jgi:GT2 family glycosyltransferase